MLITLYQQQKMQMVYSRELTAVTAQYCMTFPLRIIWDVVKW